MSEPSRPDGNEAVDWTITTYAGARREQLRRWSRLSLPQIILALEEMEELSRRFGSSVTANPPR